MAPRGCRHESLPEKGAGGCCCCNGMHGTGPAPPSKREASAHVAHVPFPGTYVPHIQQLASSEPAAPCFGDPPPHGRRNLQ